MDYKYICLPFYLLSMTCLHSHLTYTYTLPILAMSYINTGAYLEGSLTYTFIIGVPGEAFMTYTIIAGICVVAGGVVTTGFNHSVTLVHVLHTIPTTCQPFRTLHTPVGAITLITLAVTLLYTFWSPVHYITI